MHIFKNCLCDSQLNNQARCEGVDFYQNWSVSRDALRRVIADGKDRLPPGTRRNVIIFGAGACRDLPLDYICPALEEVVLVDIDGESLDASRQYIPEGFEDRVCRVVWDVTGPWGEMFDGVLAQARGRRFAGVYEVLNHLAAKGRDVEVGGLPEAISSRMPYSLVISDLILSQLIYSAQGRLVEALKLVSGGTPLPDLSLDLNILSSSLGMHHLRLLYRAAGEKGTVLVLCDTFLLGYATNGSESLFNEVLAQEGDRLLTRAITRRDISRWFQRYAITGSDILKTMRLNGFRKFRVISRVWWWWPLCDSRWFLVICYQMRPSGRDLRFIDTSFWGRLKYWFNSLRQEKINPAKRRCAIRK